MTHLPADPLIGTVKGPGDLPHEYRFITNDNAQARIGEFVYYKTREAETEIKIIGHITDRQLVRKLPDSFLADANIAPSTVSALIGLQSEGGELYEITVETIGYYHPTLKDFVNPRIPPQPGDQAYLAASETLAGMLSSKQRAEAGSAHIGSLLTREVDAVPVVLSVKDVVSTHLAILASTGSGKSYTAGVLVEELLRPYNGAAVLIVDPHGEYGTLKTIADDPRFHSPDGRYKPAIKIFPHDRIKVRFSTLNEADIKYLLPEGTSDKMLHSLSQAFRALKETLKKDDQRYGYHDLRDFVVKEKYGSDDGRGNAIGNVSSI